MTFSNINGSDLILSNSDCSSEPSSYHSIRPIWLRWGSLVNISCLKNILRCDVVLVSCLMVILMINSVFAYGLIVPSSDKTFRYNVKDVKVDVQVSKKSTYCNKERNVDRNITVDIGKEIGDEIPTPSISK
jgi:hypothetical protein